ncbi:hypothetical protein SprV_0100142000 [Sparganum proliferum]
MDDERLPKRLFYEDVPMSSTPTKSSPALQVYSENLPEVPGTQSGQMEGSHLEPTNVDENSEDRRRDLWNQAHHRPQSQTRSTQIPAAVGASKRQRPTALNVSTVSADIPGASWTCSTPSDQLQHPGCTKRRLFVHLSLASQAVS